MISLLLPKDIQMNGASQVKLINEQMLASKKKSIILKFIFLILTNIPLTGVSPKINQGKD